MELKYLGKNGWVKQGIYDIQRSWFKGPCVSVDE
jgi:hypothetical protein